MNATEVLARAGVNTLPVDPAEIAEYFGIKLVSYSACARIYEMEMSELYGHSRYGFGFYADGQYVCAVNENACGETRRRWTMAHELAHCFLGHIVDESADKSPVQEREADSFAAELLAPLVALHFCGVSSSREIARLCMISEQAAEIRFKELCRCRRAAADSLHGTDARQSGGLALDSWDNVQLLVQFAPFVGKYLNERARHDGYEQYLERCRRDRLLAEAPRG